MRTLTFLRELLLGLSAVILVVGPTRPSDREAGTIKSTVVLKGTTPELKKLAVTIDQYVCGKEKNPEDLVLSPQHGIRSAVVWLDKPPAATSGEALPSTTSMDEKECMFTLVGPLQLKGFHRPVVAYEIAHLKQPAT